MNGSPYKHRVLHDKCWKCNAKLIQIENKFGFNCEHCKTFYPQEIIRVRKLKLRGQANE